MTAAGEDWTKFVTLNPPNEVRFKFEDKQEIKTEESMIELDNKKAIARIEIINKSKSTILFKVSLKLLPRVSTFQICSGLTSSDLGQNHEHQKLHGQAKCRGYSQRPPHHRQDRHAEPNLSCK